MHLEQPPEDSIEDDTPETEEDDDEGFLPQPEDDEPETDEEEDGEEEEEEEPDTVEVEVNGKTYKVPVELKDGYLMQGDYTRKTQEIAELRKQLEPLVTQAEEASQIETQAQQALSAIDYQIRQFDNIDWQAWRQTDPQSALQGQVDLQTLINHRGRVEQEHTQAQQQRLSIAEQETARRFDEGRRVLSENIPDFPQKAPKLAEYAIKEYGFTPAELGGIEDPRFFIALNRLVDLENEVKTNKAAQKVKSAVEIKPAAKIKGKSGSVKTGLHDGLSTAEWIRRDQARSAQRR